MKKRIISLLLILAMCLSVQCFAVSGVYAADSSSGYAPLLEALGVINEGAVPASSVTRIEFLKSALKLLGNESTWLGTGEDVEVTDVASGSENYNYLKFAMQSGVVSKAPEFRPNDPITYNEAAKILVNILGYSSLAEAQGGYPAGYARVANALDLNDGVPSSEQYVSADSFVQLLVNTLEASPASVSQIVDGNMELKLNGGDPFMQISFNLYRGEGIADANSFTSIYAASTLSKGEIRIDGEVYECDNAVGSDMLGINCEFYYKMPEGSNQKTIVFITPIEDENNIYSFDGEKIDETKFDGDEFEYFDESSNRKSLKVSSTASYIYNDALKGRSEINLAPSVGSLTLIDNNGDKVIDVVKVVELSVGVVSAVSAHADVIAVKNGGSIELDLDEDVITVIKNGKSSEPSQIVPENIISWYSTDLGDFKSVMIYVSDTVITGTISESGNDTVMIDGREYKYLSSLINSLKLGITQKFYVDSFGVIADIISLDDVYVYGWLYGVKKEGMDGVMVKIFTENNRWVELYLADKVRTENGRVDAESWYANAPASQLVRYKVNSDAKVTELLTATETERWSEAEKTAISEDIFRLSLSLKNVAYRGGTSSLENKVYFASCGKIFYIPDDESDTDAYEIISISKNFAYDATISEVYAYDMDVFAAPKAMVIRHPDFSRSYDDFFIFDRVTRSISDSGDENYRLCGMFRGYEVKFPTKDLSLTEALSYNKGDIIKVKFNTDGEVIALEKQYDIVADADRNFVSGALYANNGYISGTVTDVDLADKKVVMNYGTETGVFTLAATSYATFDTQTEEAKSGSIADIMPGMKIFARMSYYRLMNVVVIK